MTHDTLQMQRIGYWEKFKREEIFTLEIISMLRSPNLVDFIPCLKHKKGCIVFQVGPLSLTLVFIHFQTLDVPLKRIAAKVKPYIKDTKILLKKLQNLPKLLDNVILGTIDEVGLYSNIPSKEDLLFPKKALQKQRNKTASTESLTELAELVLLL